MNLRHPSVQFALVTAAAMIALYGRMAISPLQEAVAASLDLSDTRMALLQGPALSLPMVVAALPLGLMIDRISRAKLLLAFALLTLIGTHLSAWAPTFIVLLVARCMVGFAATATAITAFAVIADLFTPERRGRASMVVVIGQVIGLSASFAVGGTLLEHLGEGSWRFALLIMSLPLVLAVIAAGLMREPERTAATDEAPAWRSIGQLLKHRPVLAVLAGLIMVEIAAVVVAVWSAPAFSRSFDASPATVGRAMAAGMLISGIAGPMIGGFLADYAQRTGGVRRTIRILGLIALLSAPIGLYPLLPDFGAAAVAMTAFKTFVSAMLVMSVVVLTIATPAHLRGLSLGMMSGTNNLFAGALAPLIVSSLSGILGGPLSVGHALGLVCMTSGVLGGMIFLISTRLLPSIRSAE